MNLDDELFHACLTNNIAQVKSAIASGANINATNPDGHSPLSIAAKGTNASLVKLLIEQGANPNHLSYPLSQGVHFRRTENISMLLKAQADVNVATFASAKPIHTAAAFCDSSIVKQLIKHGANPNDNTYYGTGPLTRAVTYDKLDNVITLIDAGADVNYATPLYVAAGGKNAMITHLLIKRGANVNQLSGTATPLMNAARHCNPQSAMLLLHAGADKSVRDATGQTAFDVASMHRCRDIVQMLSE